MLDDANPTAVHGCQSEIIRQGTAGLVSPPDTHAGSAGPEEAAGFSGSKTMEPPFERWYAVRHKVHEAPVARLKIRKLGFVTHWPRYILRRPRRDDVITPLFPGYLFVRAEFRHRSWGPIQAIDEVVGLLGAIDGKPPAAARVGEIEKLIQRAGGVDRVIDETPDSLMELMPGDDVMIVDGIFSGWKGMLGADKGEARVAVMMTMFGVEREVIIPKRVVRRADS